jgi:hypothetical protein
MNPRLAVLVGVTFVVLGVTLYLAPTVFGGHVDFAGVTMLLFLSVAMSVLFYVLAAGAPRGE